MILLTGEQKQVKEESDKKEIKEESTTSDGHVQSMEITKVQFAFFLVDQ